jgi:hypothetical protein
MGLIANDVTLKEFIEVGGLVAAYLGLVLHVWRFRREKPLSEGPDLKIECECHHRAYLKRGTWITKIKPIFKIMNGGKAGTTIHEVLASIQSGLLVKETSFSVQSEKGGRVFWVGPGKIKYLKQPIYLPDTRIENHVLSCEYVLKTAHGQKTVPVTSTKSDAL